MCFEATARLDRLEELLDQPAFSIDLDHACDLLISVNGFGCDDPPIDRHCSFRCVYLLHFNKVQGNAFREMLRMLVASMKVESRRSDLQSRVARSPFGKDLLFLRGAFAFSPSESHMAPKT